MKIDRRSRINVGPMTASAYADRSYCKCGGGGAIFNAKLCFEVLVHRAWTKIENLRNVAI